MKTKEIAKKTIILYVLKMLEEGSSKEQPITITGMTNTLHSLGIECNRKTIGRNVQYIMDFGYYNVIKTSKGYYIDKNKKDI